MADDELDSLYWVQPGAFTAQRTKLTAAAKQRGDDAAVKRISAARKPTTAAWIANRLVLRDKGVKRRLADLGDRLRAAHAAVDGDRIRELSAEQRKLIDELARAAFEAADVKNPSPTVRDDLTTTLQAAIADPEVRTRLGRLARAETWSGFGGFGDTTPMPAKEPQRVKDAHRRQEKLNAALAAAERAKAEADRVLSDRRAERDAARQRRDEAVASLREAERELNRADDRYDKAKQESSAAAELVKGAKAQLKRG
jgi:tetratricopeptide (TPR) repeat protein